MSAKLPTSNRARPRRSEITGLFSASHLRARGGSRGVFSLARPVPGPFPKEQIELVRTFADQAMIAIENARLFDEVKAQHRAISRESLQQQTATADVLKVISRSAFDLQAVLHTLVELAAKLCDADGALITREVDGVLYRAESVRVLGRAHGRNSPPSGSSRRGARSAGGCCSKAKQCRSRM